MKGLALMGNGAEHTSTLNVKSGNTFVITGTANTGTAEATVGGKNYGDFQITAYDGAGQNNRNQNTVINVEGTLTANSRFSVAGGTGTFNVRNGGTVNMLDGTAEGGANTAIIYNVDNGGRVNIASYESDRKEDGDNNVTLKLADGATVGGIADSSRGEEIYMLQKVEVGGTATIDTDAATYDTTSFVVTETDNGSDMVFTRDITSKQGTDDAVLKVAGHGTAHVAGTANLTGGVQVEADAALAVSSATLNSNPVNSSVNALASISSADGATAATMEGAVRFSHTDSTARIEGEGAEQTTINNSLITIAQGASLTVDNMIISESSRISGRASAATFAAREAATPNVTLTNSTIELGNGNAELAGGGAPITINPGKLTSMDGSATDVWMTGPFTALSVESSALDSLTLNAGSSFLVDFSSLLADVSIDNIDLIELSFSGVAFDSMSDITISGVYNGHQMTAYFHTPHATGVPNVGSMYFAVDAIPEPTTSTLSILALAALAARRRRK